MSSAVSSLGSLSNHTGPAGGAIVMGTGIVSVALSLDDRELLSRVLLGVAAAAWLILGALAVRRGTRDHTRLIDGAHTPVALTAVAGTAVLGIRVGELGWISAAHILLAIALVLWVGILVAVLRHWSTPALGSSFMLTVATESLAVLAAELALEQDARWLLVASLMAFLLGLGFYLFVAGSFDFRQLATGQGDHWLTGGALAISTVAAGEIALTANGLDAFGRWDGALTDLSVVLWVLTMLWLPVLLVAELRWRRMSYDIRRWSTVFPVGMYAACSFEVGEAASVGVITDFADVWVWVAALVWMIVATGLVRRVDATLRTR